LTARAFAIAISNDAVSGHATAQKFCAAGAENRTKKKCRITEDFRVFLYEGELQIGVTGMRTP
jgi:hypothetical protein